MSVERERGASAKAAQAFTKADKAKLKRFINEADALKLQQGEIAAQLKEMLDAAEEAGFSKKRINEVLRKRRLRRKHTKSQVDDAQLELELYWEASGGDKFADALGEDELYEDLDDDPAPRGGRGLN